MAQENNKGEGFTERELGRNAQASKPRSLRDLRQIFEGD
jgi:hypothetical protein